MNLYYFKYMPIFGNGKKIAITCKAKTFIGAMKQFHELLDSEIVNAFRICEIKENNRSIFKSMQHYLNFN